MLMWYHLYLDPHLKRNIDLLLHIEVSPHRNKTGYLAYDPTIQIVGTCF